MADYKINNTVSNDENDWRYNGQLEYLNRCPLLYKNYKRYSPSWDHEHCDFCTEKFSEYEGDLHEGYCTIDERHWICADCFEDFKDMFQWEVINEDEA